MANANAPPILADIRNEDGSTITRTYFPFKARSGRTEDRVIWKYMHRYTYTKSWPDGAKVCIVGIII